MNRRRTPALSSLIALIAAILPVAASATDLSGFWWVRNHSGRIEIDAAHIPLLPAARKRYNANRVAAAQGKNIPDGIQNCMPDGPTRLMLKPYPFQILQRPEQVTMLFERQHMVRFLRIGAAHEPDYYPLYIGDSTAQWDGDTLVVETEGLNDQTVLDDSGLPHSDQLTLTERFALADDGKTLVVDTTVIDPVTYAAPWTYRATFERRSDVTLMDDVCTYGPPQRDTLAPEKK